MATRSPFRTAAQLRARLLVKGFTPRPRCPLCSEQQDPKQFAPHTRQCERDSLALVIEACDRRLAYLWSWEPIDDEHAQRIGRETMDLSAERWCAYTALVGVGGGL